MDWLQITNYARHAVARLSQSGWRPAFGWGGGIVLLNALWFALVIAPQRGIQLDGAYYNFLLGALGIFVAAFITREVGKHLERTNPAPGGGLVNNAALS